MDPMWKNSQNKIQYVLKCLWKTWMYSCVSWLGHCPAIYDPKIAAWFTLYTFVFRIPKSWCLWSDIFQIPPRKIAKSHFPVIITVLNLVPFFLKNPESWLSNKQNPGSRKTYWGPSTSCKCNNLKWNKLQH